MTIDEARALLSVRVAANTEPALDAVAIEALLAGARRADSAGFAPSDAAWTPTWDLNAAAAEGWRWKAARAVGNVDVTAEGLSLSRSQLVAQCERQAEFWRRRIVSVVPLTPR